MTIKIIPSPHKENKGQLNLKDPGIWTTEAKCCHTHGNGDTCISCQTIRSGLDIEGQYLQQKSQNIVALDESKSNTGTVSSKSSQTDDDATSSVSATESEEAAAHGKAFCWGLCCVTGCVWGLIGMIYFFIFLPSGFLLIFYGVNKNLAWAIVTGSVLLVSSTCGLPALCLGIRYHRRKKRDKRHAYKRERDKQLAQETYDNPAENPDTVSQDSQEDGVVMT